MWPYPSSEDLQSTLDNHIRWDYHKKLNMKKSLRDVRMRNLPPNDSRAHLSVPKVGEENSYWNGPSWRIVYIELLVVLFDTVLKRDDDWKSVDLGTEKVILLIGYGYNFHT